MYLLHITQFSKLVIFSINLRTAAFLKFLEIRTFQDKTTKDRGKKDQRLPTSQGGISNQQTDPGVGSNDQPEE